MAEARDKILRYYQSTEHNDTAIRIVDFAEQVERTQKVRLTGFLSPAEQEIAEIVATTYGNIKVSFDGGYQGAERQRGVLYHNDFLGKSNYEIVVLKVEWNDEFSKLYHRDFLGSILGLGIERSYIGDILVSSGFARVLVDKRIAEFIVENLSFIGRTKVNVFMDELKEISPKEERSKEISTTVASLRIDAIVAAGFGISRSRAVADIDVEKVKLNWQQVKGAAQIVKMGDVISLRGRGRLEITDIRGNTKKGRIALTLTRFF